MDTLFADELLPATERLGFRRSLVDAVVETYAEWRARLGKPSHARRHDAPLRARSAR